MSPGRGELGWVSVGHVGLSEWHFDLPGPERNQVIIESDQLMNPARKVGAILNAAVDVEEWRSTVSFRHVALDLASAPGTHVGVHVATSFDEESDGGLRCYTVSGPWRTTTLALSKPHRAWHLLAIVTGVLLSIAEDEGWSLPPLPQPQP